MLMRLAELQQSFQARLLTQSTGIESHLAERSAPDFHARLDAYVGGYRARILEALGVTYAALSIALGDQEFADRMQRYIEEHPSCHPSIRHYGSGVAAMLRAAPASDADARVTLGDLAAW